MTQITQASHACSMHTLTMIYRTLVTRLVMIQQTSPSLAIIQGSLSVCAQPMRRYIVTSSLIGWKHTENDLWSYCTSHRFFIYSYQSNVGSWHQMTQAPPLACSIHTTYMCPLPCLSRSYSCCVMRTTVNSSLLHQWEQRTGQLGPQFSLQWQYLTGNGIKFYIAVKLRVWQHFYTDIKFVISSGA